MEKFKNFSISIKELRQYFNITSIAPEVDKILLANLTTQKALDEFRTKGTIEGETIDEIVSNEWARNVFKPAMKGLVYSSYKDVEVLKGHTNQVVSAVFSSDGNQIVTASWDNTTRVWSKQLDGSWTSQILTGYTGSLKSAVFSPDGNQIITASFDDAVRGWTKQLDGSWTAKVFLDDTDRVRSAVFSPDGNQMVTVSRYDAVRVWTKQQDVFFEISQVLFASSMSSVSSAVFSPDGNQIVIALNDFTSRVFTKKPDSSWISQVLSGHSNFVASAVFSPDGNQIATTSYDLSLRLWTRIDLVGETNVAKKIMLLQLLHRDGKKIFNEQQHPWLSVIFTTFDQQAKEYLIKKYRLPIEMVG